MRILISTDPPYDRSRHYNEWSPWKPKWVSHPDAPGGTEFERPFVCVYRLGFTMPGATTVRVHVSADERYTLWVDGRELGVGPERGDPANWCLETYDIALSAGAHEIEARVHSLGQHRPYAQMSVRHAFLLMAEGEHEALLSTGIAPWEAAHVDAYTCHRVSLPRAFVATGGRFTIDGATLTAERKFVPTVEVGLAVPASARMESPGRWQLVPAALPEMHSEVRSRGRIRHLDDAGPGGPDDAAGVQVRAAARIVGEVGDWQDLLVGEASVTVPPHTTRRAIIDLDDYCCAYPRVTLSGGKGATVRVEFAEALFEPDGFTKLHRDEIEGLYFRGQGDTLLPAGGRRETFVPLWWLAGRYVEVAVRTGDEPVRIDRIDFVETHYPYAWESVMRTSEPRLDAVIPVARRTLEMCSHDTYMDCPYYEQLMYVGDTRLEVLATYAMTHDDRLPRKAIALFDQSRTAHGWTAARYPTKTTQTIPPFSLWWVAMVWDYMMWRAATPQGRAFVREQMGGVRAVMEAARSRVGADGLWYPPQGWNFVDWIAHLSGMRAEENAPGAPTHGPGPTATLHYQMAYTLKLAGELEEFAGEPELAARHRSLHAKMIAAGERAFWSGAGATGTGVAGVRDLYRELPHGVAVPGGSEGASGWKPYTEHAQCLAVLAGAVPEERNAGLARALFAEGDDVAPTTIYFAHYLFEACAELEAYGGVERMFRKLELWYGLTGRGFRTTFEMPEPTRSDCHAWGAHPLYHLYATILGVRPASPGFGRVRITPRLGPVAHAYGALVHPRGMLSIDARSVGGRTVATVRLPEGVTGTLVTDGEEREI